MKYINESVMSGLDAAAFQQQRPYPWLAIREGFLTADGFPRLADRCRSRSWFDKRFGEAQARPGAARPSGAGIRPDLPLAQPWRELSTNSAALRIEAFSERMFGRRALRLILHWHYTPNGCSVSPHCDARRKLGSHIFYFNTDKNWQPDWGGETLHPRRQRPLSRRFGAQVRGLRPGHAGQGHRQFQLCCSMRRERSWHGAKEITLPARSLAQGVHRVVIEDWDLKASVKSLLRGTQEPLLTAL